MDGRNRIIQFPRTSSTVADRRVHVYHLLHNGLEILFSEEGTPDNMNVLAYLLNKSKANFKLGTYDGNPAFVRESNFLHKSLPTESKRYDFIYVPLIIEEGGKP